VSCNLCDVMQAKENEFMLVNKSLTYASGCCLLQVVNVFKVVLSWRTLSAKDFEEVLMVLMYNSCIGCTNSLLSMSTSVRALVDGFISLTIPGEQFCDSEQVSLASMTSLWSFCIE
jgi:hypothetical protein